MLHYDDVNFHAYSKPSCYSSIVKWLMFYLKRMLYDLRTSLYIIYSLIYTYNITLLKIARHNEAFYNDLILNN